MLLHMNIFKDICIYIISGSPISTEGRCLCKDSGSDFILPKRIEKIEVFPRSPSCENIEIVATVKKSGDKLCLNSQSKWVQNIINLMTKRSPQTAK
ncbi:C-X-C motif chemokine 10-like [Protopterus annectens]|uniref:C-X-C motif chemokine 10-like n=1 Tax=Protopterus annectens TaxID=7888 RepID=UPI001CFA66B6|nr:C-X-C motif chemokine 10-like [Protopterus annectens]